MKKCPVIGCDVQIKESEVVCHGCLRSCSRNVQSEFSAAWRTFARTFRPDDMAAYERAARAVIVEAGQKKRPQQLPLDG